MHRGQYQLKVMVLVVLVMLTGTTLFVLHRSAHNAQHHPFTIVCTTSILADTVSNIVGNHASVISLMGPGIDPHVYRARESDLTKLLSADIIIYNGLHLEGKMADILQKMPQVPTIAASDALASQQLLQLKEYPNLYDPHVWFDVSLWKDVVRYVSKQIIHHDHIHASAYTAATHAYCIALDELDGWVHKQIDTIPVTQRILITAHDAFGYFGRRYGLAVMGLQGISTDSEPGITDIQEITATIVTHNIHAIFVETSVPPRALQAVQAAAHAHGVMVKLHDQLYSDTLGEPESAAAHYSDMVKHNVRTIVAGLT